MIGIFDSGVGGLAAYKEVRRLAPQADIVYLADRKNAPYGTKGREELIKLVNKDVSRLREMGATSSENLFGFFIVSVCGGQEVST